MLRKTSKNAGKEKKVAAERQEQEQKGREMFRIPMGTSAFELQKRLKQLIENGMLYNFTHDRPPKTSDSDREYAVMSTIYAFAKSRWT